MNTPKSTPPDENLLDSCESLMPNMGDEKGFLIKSVIKYINFFGGTWDVESGREQNGNF
jgi:hypothetical protein